MHVIVSNTIQNILTFLELGDDLAQLEVFTGKIRYIFTYFCGAGNGTQESNLSLPHARQACHYWATHPTLKLFQKIMGNH